MPLRQERLAFRPFEYDWAFEAWFKQQSARWMYHTIPMQADIRNWNYDLTLQERNVVGNILKGFALTEVFVNEYWTNKVTKWFPVHEIRLMATTFGDSETVHALAYDHLNQTLGLDDYQAFLSDEATMTKLSVLMEASDDDSIENIARSIALFSACAEGIQLFASFAVLMSFRKSNRLIGTSTQMVYSVADESLHSEYGCKLFRQLVSENPHVWTESFKQSIYGGVKLALDNEFIYLDKIFEMGDLPTITKAHVKNFMYDRANRKLRELMLDSVYDVDDTLLEEMDWFYSYISLYSRKDFFDGHETQYAKPPADFYDDESPF